jgi:hypothetical protein
LVSLEPSSQQHLFLFFLFSQTPAYYFLQHVEREQWVVWLAELWRGQWWHTPSPIRPNSDMLAILIDRSVARGGYSRATWLAQLQQGARGLVGDSNNVPCARRCATVVKNIVAFFVRMGTYVNWQGGDCGDNGGSNVLTLAAARMGN